MAKQSEKTNRMPPLTVVVLRGLRSAIVADEMNIQVSEPGDFHRVQLEEHARAAAWVDAMIARKGWARLYPHLKVQPMPVFVRDTPDERKLARKAASIAKRRRVRVV